MMLDLEPSEHLKERVVPATILAETEPLRKVIIVAHRIYREYKYMELVGKRAGSLSTLIEK